MAKPKKQAPVELSQEEIDTAFSDGAAQYDLAKHETDSGEPNMAGDHANPHAYFDMDPGPKRNEEVQRHKHWDTGWGWAKAGKPARPHSGLVEATETTPLDPNATSSSTLTQIDANILDICKEITEQNHVVKERKGEWTAAKEALAIAKKKLDDEQNGLCELVDALEEAQSGQLRLPYSKTQSQNGEQSNAVQPQDTGDPKPVAVAKDTKDEIAPVSEVSAIAMISVIVDGKKKKISKAILKKLDAYTKPLQSVAQFREFRRSVPLWTEALGLTTKQDAELTAIMDAYDTLFPASFDEPATQNPPGYPLDDDENLDENGLFVSGYDEPPLEFVFRKLSKFHARCQTIHCADGKWRAAWDAGEKSDLENKAEHTFTPNWKSPSFPTRTDAVLNAAALVMMAILDTDLAEERSEDLSALIADSIPTWGLDESEATNETVEATEG